MDPEGVVAFAVAASIIYSATSVIVREYLDGLHESDRLSHEAKDAEIAHLRNLVEKMTQRAKDDQALLARLVERGSGDEDAMPAWGTPAPHHATKTRPRGSSVDYFSYGGSLPEPIRIAERVTSTMNSGTVARELTAWIPVRSVERILPGARAPIFMVERIGNNILSRYCERRGYRFVEDSARFRRQVMSQGPSMAFLVTGQAVDGIDGT